MGQVNGTGTPGHPTGTENGNDSADCPSVPVKPIELKDFGISESPIGMCLGTYYSKETTGTPGHRDPIPGDFSRPVTRGDCEAEERACPWVSCKWHLYLDVHPETGVIKLNFPHLEVWELEETCALDVAGREPEEGNTREHVGRIMGISKARIQQIEGRALTEALPMIPRAYYPAALRRGS